MSPLRSLIQYYKYLIPSSSPATTTKKTSKLSRSGASSNSGDKIRRDRERGGTVLTDSCRSSRWDTVLLERSRAWTMLGTPAYTLKRPWLVQEAAGRLSHVLQTHLAGHSRRSAAGNSWPAAAATSAARASNASSIAITICYPGDAHWRWWTKEQTMLQV